MKQYTPLLTTHAKSNFSGIISYLIDNVSPAFAKKVQNEIDESLASLCEMPERGHYPPEMILLDEYRYREIHCSRFRIIFRIQEDMVYVYGILDDRRDIQELLEERLNR